MNEIQHDIIHVMIVDDHQVVADGISALLEKVDDIQLKHHAANGKSALELLYQHPEINFILLDINLPDMNGINLCQRIKLEYPDKKVLALTMHHETGFITKMIKAGADGYLLKNTGKEELLEAIYEVQDGEKYYSKQVKDFLVKGLQPVSRYSQDTMIQKITRREKEILRLIVEELTTDEIAAKLFISSSTVISHRKSLLRKLQAKNTAGLVKAAYEFNLLN